MSPDWKGPNRWYRFDGAAGHMMPESPPAGRKYFCGTQAPGYIQGRHPRMIGELKRVIVCFDGMRRRCQWKTQIDIVKCNENKYSYKLPTTPACPLRYCGASKPRPRPIIKLPKYIIKIIQTIKQGWTDRKKTMKQLYNDYKEIEEYVNKLRIYLYKVKDRKIINYIRRHIRILNRRRTIVMKTINKRIIQQPKPKIKVPKRIVLMFSEAKDQFRKAITKSSVRQKHYVYKRMGRTIYKLKQLNIKYSRLKHKPKKLIKYIRRQINIITIRRDFVMRTIIHQPRPMTKVPKYVDILLSKTKHLFRNLQSGKNIKQLRYGYKIIVKMINKLRKHTNKLRYEIKPKPKKLIAYLKKEIYILNVQRGLVWKKIRKMIKPVPQTTTIIPVTKSRTTIKPVSKARCLDDGCMKAFGGYGVCVDFSAKIDFKDLAKKYDMTQGSKTGVCDNTIKKKKDCCHCLKSTTKPNT